jgi:hypothetical protein
VALVGLDGGIWLCLPRFDSEPLLCGPHGSYDLEQPRRASDSPRRIPRAVRDTGERAPRRAPAHRGYYDEAQMADDISALAGATPHAAGVSARTRRQRVAVSSNEGAISGA